ncbi:fungal-specific transcription factor domain-containing protein [Dactylonectria estremocensis]|uniref:Fungal-specific transcription factor domain-containing protein n=1 Tax=Dactylonectria estremocensis TaxID=1079267 RepID=A0A9P9EC61_9HYPO|nr:fungal-specific transcription factor domain-containing protein [Dactylonectria estremocensis]
MAKLGDGPTKGVQCSVCGERFSRTDHLKRHQLRHSGVKPYSCIFCNDAFTRSDNLRDHYPSCPQRKNRQIPEAAKGGRRSHACDSASTSSSAPKSGTDNNQSDRGSINFLLNSGTASFIECFRFPSSHERRNLFNFLNAHASSNSVDVFDIFGNSSENGSIPSDVFDDESIDWSLFEQENPLRFLSSPVGEMPVFGSELPIAGYSFTGDLEPPSLQSAAIVDAILEKALSLQTVPQEQVHISQNLNFVFTPSRIDKFVGLYFEFWHPHCPIIHQGSFTIQTAPIPLLASTIVMGAMYSQVDTEVSTAKLVLDLVELYIFSLEDLTDEYEIRQMLRVASISAPESIQLSVLAFQHLQAAYLMVCVQFWAVSMISRKRSSDTRFGVVVKVARRLGLTKARHQLDDIVDESLWIQTESRIRLINIMTLLDCAFSFFANFPCRLSMSEMKFDLPCEESLFASPHPFAERNVTLGRSITTVEAFQSLFKPSLGSFQGTKSNPLGLNPMDMFILIHLLYVSAHTQITHFPSSIPRPPYGSGNSTPAGLPGPPLDSKVAAIKAALSRWRSLWITIRSNIPTNSWASLGFFRNGYNYWLVIQLIMNTKGSADVLMGMEVGCEDTLKQLKGMLKEGRTDS